MADALSQRGDVAGCDGRRVEREAAGHGKADVGGRVAGRLAQLDGRRLTEGRYRRQIEHFKEAAEATYEQLWVYAASSAAARRIRDPFAKNL